MEVVPIMVLSFFVAVFAAGGVLGAMAVLVLGVHLEEWRMSVKTKRRAATRLESGTRRVLRVGLHNPLASTDQRDSDAADR
jgi:hypothetical protein